MEIIKYMRNKGLAESHLEELDAPTNEKVVSLEYNTRRVRLSEFERQDNLAITQENIVSLDYDTIINGLLEWRKNNLVKTEEKVIKTKRKNKKYDPKVPRQMESSRKKYIVKTNDQMVSSEYDTRLNGLVETRRPGNKAYETRVNSLEESRRRNDIVKTIKNVVSLEYENRVPRPVASKSKDNIVETNDIAVSSEFDTRSNELTEARRDSIAETNENRDTEVSKSVNYKRGKIQQHDKSRNIEKRKPRQKMIKAAEWVKTKKLFDIVVHIKA